MMMNWDEAAHFLGTHPVLTVRGGQFWGDGIKAIMAIQDQAFEVAARKASQCLGGNDHLHGIVEAIRGLKNNPEPKEPDVTPEPDDVDQLLRNLGCVLSGTASPADEYRRTRQAVEAFRDRAYEVAAAQIEREGEGITHIVISAAAATVRALKNKPEPQEPTVDEQRQAAVAMVRNNLEHSIRRSAKASADEFQAALDAYNATLEPVRPESLEQCDREWKIRMILPLVEVISEELRGRGKHAAADSLDGAMSVLDELLRQPSGKPTNA